ncbi:hypothetical protein [Nitrospira defluvii]|uniref:EfeO-type cupredoxin-like domain-containing protein n=1 Tax=Nitrospira defluvii TaxID=330214 RepID=A0ABN7L2R8_9BACT|nr:hypothetical protein [Nitrospira defluvii]CAE6727471.1 conserved exported hypothetical protein [Nitrospira defluvii]
MKTMTHVLAALAVLTLSACSHSPTATKTVSETEAGTRTGMVRNIVINETIHPETLTVRAGDEIRWINQRQDAVTITIDQALDHTVSCRNGFSKSMGMGIDNSTKLASHETAGLCFTRIGTFKYSVHASSDDKHDLPNTHGSVTVQ